MSYKVNTVTFFLASVPDSRYVRVSDKGFNRYSHDLPAPLVVMLSKQSCKR